MDIVNGLALGILAVASFTMGMIWVGMQKKRDWIPVIIVTLLTGVMGIINVDNPVISVTIPCIVFILVGLFYGIKWIGFMVAGVFATCFELSFFPLLSFMGETNIKYPLFATLAFELTLCIFICSVMTYYEQMRMPSNWFDIVGDGEKAKFLPFILTGFTIFAITAANVLFTTTSNRAYNILQVLMNLLLIGLGCFALHSRVTLICEKSKNSIMVQLQSESGEYMKIVRSQRHDFNFHLHAISGLIESKEYAECHEYVQGMILEASDVNDVMPIKDAAIGSMLYNFRRKARKSGVEIRYDITYDLANIACSSYECNKILGNLLQNALDAMVQVKEENHGIDVIIMKRRGNSVMIVENQGLDKERNFSKEYLLGKSTKSGHEGIGLSVVEQIVLNYGGRFYTEIQDERIRFVVNIPNKLSINEGENK